MSRKVTRLHETFGVYGMSTFMIEILKWDYPNECWSGKEGFSTFFHEYIHHLQDTTSFFGASMFDWLLVQVAALQRIYFHTESPVLRFSDSTNSNPRCHDRESVPAKEALRESQEFLKLLNGDSSLPIEEFTRIRSHRFREVDLSIHGKNTVLKSVELELHGCEDESGAATIRLGATIIQESMAFALECLVSEELGEHSFVPYRVGRSLCEMILNAEVDDQSFVVICDASLQDPLPGVAFIEICEFVKSSGISPKGSHLDLLAKISTRLRSTIDLEANRRGLVSDFSDTLGQMIANVEELTPQLRAIASLYGDNLQKRVDDPLFLSSSLSR